MIAPNNLIFFLSMASSTYQAESLHVGVLLSSVTRERIIVPQFQRGYEWKEKQVKDFWKDIRDFKRDSILEDGPSAHFFGPVVLKYQDKTIELLDGQQRLATVTIFVSVLRDLAKEIPSREAEDFARDTQRQFILKGNEGYALQLGDTDSSYFREYIQHDGPEKPSSDQRTHRNIRDARELLWKCVVEEIGSAQGSARLLILESLRQIIQSDLVMASIRVATDTDAFRIFETLNDRGISLSAPDLLLNYLMKKAVGDEDRKIIRKLWTEMVEDVEDLNLKDYIRHLWTSKYGDIKSEGTFAIISQHIYDNRIDSVSFARSCAEECGNYVAIASYDEEKLGKDAARLIRVIISDFRSDSAIPVLLSALMLFKDKEEILKLCQWLVVFLVRYSALANQDKSGVETLFFSLAKDLRSKVASDPPANTSECMDGLKKSLMGKASTDAQIQTLIPKMDISDGEGRYIMTQIANFVQAENKEVKLDKVSLEHIYPKNPEDNEWGGPSNQAKLDPLRFNLGNLTMLGKKLNSNRVKNSEYQIKRPYYANDSKVVMNQKIAEIYDEWTDSVILERAKHVIEKALLIWNFDRPSRV